MNIPFQVVIPARYAATRLPGKMLADVAGQPMIWHVWQRAQGSAAAEVLIATDDERIKTAAERFGARVIMTATQHASGTDRIAEVSRLQGWSDHDIVVNVQGDEPLLPSAVIDQVATLLVQQPDCMMATLCEPIHTRAELYDPHSVKVVRDEQGCALYFSRAPIPWLRGMNRADAASPLPDQANCHRHLGIYAYRVAALQQFAASPPGVLEQLEQLEQLRMLAQSVKIAVAPACKSTPGGVDTQADLERVRARLK